VNFIHKHNEPNDFTEWKKSNGIPGNDREWDNLRNPEKDIVHHSLLNEQGAVCCYCEQKVSDTESHIEHIKPQSSYLSDRFDYNNLLASCEGSGHSNHCGHAKSSWYEASLFVSPLQQNCHTFFKFTSAGEIKQTDDPEKKPAAVETINHLKLNHSSLTANRKATWEGLFDESLSDEDLKSLREKYVLPDTSGQFSPFRAFVDYILSLYIG